MMSAISRSKCSSLRISTFLKRALLAEFRKGVFSGIKIAENVHVVMSIE